MTHTLELTDHKLNVIKQALKHQSEGDVLKSDIPIHEYRILREQLNEKQ